MLGIQAAGSAPVYFDRVFDHPETIASAIRIGHPASWEGARTARSESGGHIEIVTDEEIVEAQKLLASREGIFVEPASAASVAGLLRCHRSERCAECPIQRIPDGAKIVLTVTGHGLKDPGTPAAEGLRPLEAPAELGAICRVLDLD
jgi:threonine synthase